VGVLPLDTGTDLGQGLVGLAGRGGALLDGLGTYTWDVALDEVLGHGIPS
jgi:hypothetical protein